MKTHQHARQGEASHKEVHRDSGPARGQQLDPRLGEPTVAALQALMALREAQLKVLVEDAKKREADWAEYSKPLWDIQK